MNDITASPPVPTEIRQIHLPDLGPDDYGDFMFFLTFFIWKVGQQLAITVRVELNPALQSSSPPVYHEFNFDGNLCEIFDCSIEDYFLQGSIEVVKMSPPNGQFDDNTKNFLFDLSMRHLSSPPQDVEGLFVLTDPNDPDNSL